MSRETEIDRRIIEVEIQLELARVVDDYLNEYPTGDNVLIPGNLGFQDQSIARMIDNYNNLVMEHARRLVNSTEKHPNRVQPSEHNEGIRTNLEHSHHIQVRA